MFYAKIENGQVVKFPLNLREEYPSTSFPDVMNDGCLPNGVVSIQPTTQPDIGVNQRAVATVVNENGNWVQQWVIEKITPDDPFYVSEEVG